MWFTDIFKQNKPILGVAPMADMTDSAFCQTIRKIGGADVVFREMVSSEALVRDSEKTLGMTDFVEAERPIVQQIFGADPETMAHAAEIVMERAHPEGIDINMGCPVYKITSNFNGSALMKDAELSQEIVRAVKAAIGDTALSVKIRLGWDDPDTFQTFIPALEAAGADLITMHGRTKEQAYSGTSDWERIRIAKEIATVPLIANGDVHEPWQVAECLSQTGADGVLIARGVLGNPWFFQHALAGTTYVTPEERVAGIRMHLSYHLAQYGVEKGMKTFRKHLSWYLKTNKIGEDVPGIKDIRSQAVRVSTKEELEEVLQAFLEACDTSK